MDLVKELVERSLTESAPSREHGRADLMRNSLADLDGDEPSTPSGSPTRSGVRPAEMASTRPSEFACLRQSLLLPLHCWCFVLGICFAIAVYVLSALQTC